MSIQGQELDYAGGGLARETNWGSSREFVRGFGQFQASEAMQQ